MFDDHSMSISLNTKDVNIQIPNLSPTMTSKSKWKKKTLYKYLADGEENYSKFAEFLSTCFALENLLFFSKVLAFRHVLLSMLREKHKNNANETDEAVLSKEDTVSNGELEFYDKWCPEGMENVFGVKFEYIDGLYESCTSNKNIAIDDIAMDIYNKFIATDGLYQVNISGFNRHEIIVFFNKNMDSDDNRKIEDYLIVFNNAIVEVYNLLKSVYAFQFKAM